MNLETSSANWQPFCLGLNVFRNATQILLDFVTYCHACNRIFCADWVKIMPTDATDPCIARGSFCELGLTLIATWIRNYIHYKLLDEITYPFPNFNDAKVGKSSYYKNTQQNTYCVHIWDMLTMGHCWGCYTGTLSSSSHCNSFEDLAPVDFIYGCQIFKWVAVAWLKETIVHQDCSPGNNCQSDMPCCLHGMEY